MASGVVTASQSNEERTLIGTSSGSAAGSEGASYSEEDFGYEGASGSHGDTIPAALVHFGLSNEADSADSTPAPSSTSLHWLLISPTGGA